MKPKLNAARSQALAARVDAEPKQCYENSMRALRLLKDACYVEGLIVLAEIPLALEHGWLECDGEILDVTLWRNPPAAYHPGARYSQLELHRSIGQIAARSNSATVFFPLALQFGRGDARFEAWGEMQRMVWEALYGSWEVAAR